MADDVFRITLSQTVYGQTMQNVTAWRFNGPLETALADAARHMDLVVEVIKAAQIFDVQYTLGVCVLVTDAPVKPMVQRTMVARGGRQAVNAATLNQAYVLQLNSGLSGKTARGRFYVGPVEPGFVPLGVFNQTCHDMWDAVLDVFGPQFIGPGTPTNWQIGILGRNKLKPDFIPCTQIALRATPGSMRTRLVGVGA